MGGVIFELTIDNAVRVDARLAQYLRWSVKCFLALFKCVQIKSFVIGLVIFPAAKDDPDPFEGQDADGAMVGFALLALGLIEGFSPFKAMDRLAGELVKGLAEELRTQEPTVNPTGFATALQYRSDAAGFLDLAGI